MYLELNLKLNKKFDVFNYGFNNHIVLNDTESFPLSIAQMLSTSLFFVENEYYNSINGTSAYDYLSEEDKLNAMLYFNYSTYYIIENSYDNLLQDQFEKLKEIPDLLTKHNDNKKKPVFLNIKIHKLKNIRPN